MIGIEIEKHCEDCSIPCLTKFIEGENYGLINQNKTILSYSAGQVIAKQGSFAPNILFLTKGLIKIVIEGKNGKNTMISLLNEGNYLSLPIFENQKKHGYTTIALSDVEICEIHEPGIRNQINNSILLSQFLLNNFFSSQIFLMNRLHLINTRNNHGKLAASLMYLNSFNQPNLPVFEYITRKDLAELSAISIESVNKILQELKNDRIIEISPKGIVLTHLNLIEKLSTIG